MKRNRMKQVGMLIGALCFYCLLSAQEVKELTILHTNDSHSRIEPLNKNGQVSERAGKGGFVRRATAVKVEREKNKEILLFDCGDFSQGTPYYNLFQGEVEIKLMNEMGYDAVAIGNHEFDFGMDNMVRLFKMAQFPIVCANYDVKGTVLEEVVKPYIILKRNGLKVGVFGLSPMLDGLVQADKCQGITYMEPNAVANEIAALLKNKEKCDVVICLSHLGWKSSSGYASDENLVANTRNIDLVLGGHSHSLIKEPAYYKDLDGKRVPVTQMGKNGMFLGRMDLKFEKK